MKTNNYGFGYKETFIYLGILLLLLLFTSYSISSFYDGMNVDNSDDPKKNGYLSNINTSHSTDNVGVNNEPTIDKNEDNNFQVIQMNHYYDEERRFYNAVMKYANDNSLPQSKYLYTIKLEDLVRLEYMEKTIVDYVDGSTCSGYGNIVTDDSGYQVEVFIYCSNYKTEGYMS